MAKSGGERLEDCQTEFGHLGTATVVWERDGQEWKKIG